MGDSAHPTLIISQCHLNCFHVGQEARAVSSFADEYFARVYGRAYKVSWFAHCIIGLVPKFFVGVSLHFLLITIFCFSVVKIGGTLEAIAKNLQSFSANFGAKQRASSNDDQLSPWPSPSTRSRGVIHLHHSFDGTTHRSNTRCAAMTATQTGPSFLTELTIFPIPIKCTQ